MIIENNRVVSIDYTIRNPEGELLEESDEGPMNYLQGSGALAPGLEKELLGKKAGDTVNITLNPDDAFGSRDDELMSEVSLQDFDDPSEVKEGLVFHAEMDGEMRFYTVISVKGDTVTIDGNHPFAGHTLNFSVSVRDVREASSEELEHGHVHDEEGHHHEH